MSWRDPLRTADNAVIEYQNFGDVTDDLEDMRGYAYRFPLWNGGDEDDCADFLLQVDRLLPGMAERYEDRGRPFTAYLYVCLRYQMMTYRRTARQELDRRDDHRLGIALGAPVDDAPAKWEARELDRATMRRDVVVAAIKASWELADNQVDVLATVTGRADLADLVERGRAAIDTTRYEKLSGRLRRSLGRRIAEETGIEADCYERAHAELRHVRMAPTNRQVAEILDMPKGSVDTALYRFRRKAQA